MSGTTRLFCCLAILVCICLCGCGNRSKIVGTWQEENGTTVYQFFKDGTVQYKDSSMTDTASYSFPDNTHLKITDGRNTMVAELKFTGDYLELTVDGMTRKLKRMR